MRRGEVEDVFLRATYLLEAGDVGQGCRELIHVIDAGDPEWSPRAGAMLGEAFRPLLTRDGAARRGFGITPADEALAMVVVEVSGKALVVSNADLTSTRAGGLRTDLAAAFLRGFSESAGLTIHVRLLEGHDSQHVLEAIFKGLGVALARACGDA